MRGEYLQGLAAQRIGHPHLWERALSRRAFLATMAGGAGIIAMSHYGPPSPVLADGAGPKPVPGGDLPGFHFFTPKHGGEPSLITDFKGVVAVAEVRGQGTGVQSGVSVPLVFDADMRFMDGIYVGTDGVPRRGTFGFV